MSAAIHSLNPQSWVHLYADELYGYAMGKTGDTGLAEDLVQETFLAALRALDEFRGQSSERTWLFAILKFKIAGHYRKASTRYEVPQPHAAEEEVYTDWYFTADGSWKESMSPKDWGIDQAAALENKELAAALHDCIGRLMGMHKQVIVAKLLDEKETEHVCKELNMTTTNYWVIIHRAKLQLRACLEKNWFNA